MEEKRYSIKSAAAQIAIACIFPLVYLVSQVVVSMVGAFAAMFSRPDALEYIMSAGVDELTTDLTANTLWFTLIACIITVAAVVITIHARGEGVVKTLRLGTPRVWQIPLAFFLGIALNVTMSYLLALIPIPEQTLSEYNELIDMAMFSGGFGLAFVTMAIAAPITEEVVFRGWSMNRLKRGLPFAGALILQSVLFAVVHGIPLQIAYVLPVAFVFGLVYEWSDNLHIAIWTHIGFNILSVVMSYVPIVEESAQAVDTATPTAIYAVVTVVGLVLVALCMTVLFKTRVKKGIVDNEQERETY